MPKAYIIVTEDIHDPEGMRRYGEAAALAMGPTPPVPLLVGPPIEVLEGEWPSTQSVVMEFESVEAARAWYHSDAYQAAAKIRQASADTNMVIFSGFARPTDG